MGEFAYDQSGLVIWHIGGTVVGDQVIVDVYTACLPVRSVLPSSLRGR